MVLGVLGGCGPAAGAHFYTRLIELTDATADREHIDVLLTGRATTPDRTAALTGGGVSPAACLVADAHFLAAGGADLLVLLCHTAHAYLSELRAAVRVPILDMVSLVVDTAAAQGITRLGILSTEGTRRARLYERAAAEYGMRILYPPAPAWEGVQTLIYGYLKQGRGDGGAALRTACAALAAGGCEGISLSCTELSLPAAGAPARLFRWSAPPGALCRLPLYDPIELLCRRVIPLCGKKLKAEKEDSPYAPWRFAVRPARRPPAGGGF